jgi:hypothetical protein
MPMRKVVALSDCELSDIGTCVDSGRDTISPRTLGGVMREVTLWLGLAAVGTVLGVCVGFATSHSPAPSSDAAATRRPTTPAAVFGADPVDCPTRDSLSESLRDVRQRSALLEGQLLLVGGVPVYWPQRDPLYRDVV